jgi:hypothetical protein
MMRATDLGARRVRALAGMPHGKSVRRLYKSKNLTRWWNGAKLSAYVISGDCSNTGLGAGHFNALSQLSYICVPLIDTY